jgi:hypothetical protein
MENATSLKTKLTETRKKLNAIEERFVIWQKVYFGHFRFAANIICNRTFSSFVYCQLNDCLNSKGESCVLDLKNLLNDCECSKPNS